MTLTLKLPVLENTCWTLAWQEPTADDKGVRVRIDGSAGSSTHSYTYVYPEAEWGKTITEQSVLIDPAHLPYKQSVLNAINADLRQHFIGLQEFIQTPPPVVQLEVQPGIVGRVSAADFRRYGHMGTVTETDIEALAGQVCEILMKSGIWKEAVEDALSIMRVIDASTPRIGALIVTAQDLTYDDNVIIPFGAVGEIVQNDGAGKIEATFEGFADAETCYELEAGHYRLLRCDNHFKVGDIVVFVEDTHVLREVPGSSSKKRRAAVQPHAIRRGQVGMIKHWRNENNVSVAVAGLAPGEWYSTDPRTVCVVTGDVTGFRQWFEDFAAD